MNFPVATLTAERPPAGHAIRPAFSLVSNVQAALRWLDARPPNVREARLALAGIAGSGEDGEDIVGSVRMLLADEPPTKPAPNADTVSAKRVSDAEVEPTDNVIDWDKARYRARHHLQRARVEKFIESRLADPNLSIASIARGAHMSVRSVYRAFSADHAGSVSRYIWLRRIRRCVADLRDPDQAHRSITDICFSWGFNSTSHFSRVFKEELGLTPRSYRAASASAADRAVKHPSYGRRSWGCSP